MSKYTVLAIKQVLSEINIEASSYEEAWTQAHELNENQFINLDNETAWKIKGVYQNNEIASA